MTLHPPLNLDQRVPSPTWREIAVELLDWHIENALDDARQLGEESDPADLRDLRDLREVVAHTTLRLTDQQMVALHAVAVIQHEEAVDVFYDTRDSETGAWAFGIQQFVWVLKDELAARGVSR